MGDEGEGEEAQRPATRSINMPTNYLVSATPPQKVEIP
jgi:hypothetical protein